MITPPTAAATIFQALADHLSFCIFDADDQGLVTYCNRAWTEMSGQSMEQALGTGWLQAVHPEDRDRIAQELSSVVQSRRESHVTSYRISRSDGPARHMRASVRALPAGPDGSAGYVGVVQDVTECLLAEQRLLQQNLLLNAILSNIPCGVSVFDARGKHLLDNALFRSLMDVPDHLLDGGPCGLDDIYRFDAVRRNVADVKSDVASRMARALDPSRSIHEEIRPDGRVLEVRHAPLPQGGMVITYTDMSAHRRALESLREAKNAAEAAGAAKAAFLATMSHEIRTPMNGVVGMTELLLNTELTAQQRDYAEVIRESGNGLLVVINDILDYSRIESGQMELEWLPLHIEHVVQGSIQPLMLEAQEKRLAVDYAIDGDVPPLVHGDGHRLQQVFLNLMSNAVKFTEHGSVRVSLRLAAQESSRQSGRAAGDMLLIEAAVQDTGIGIAADQIGRLFQPFVQADSSAARRFGGTGLGLAITARLVKALGGCISIESQPALGTTVRFSFLAERAAPELTVSSDTVLAGRRVLLAGLAPWDLRPLSAHLTRWGVDPRVCERPSEAVSRLADGEPFDLVITTAERPGTDIDSFARQLRKARPVPIAFVPQQAMGAPNAIEPRADMLPRIQDEVALYEALLALLSRTGAANAGGRRPQFDATLATEARLRVLVAEDHAVNCKVIAQMLRGFGYEADMVHNGVEAVEAAARKAYDLIFMDVQMPGMDGLEASRTILANSCGGARPRIVAISATVMKDDIDAALAAGVDDYLAKPFGMAELRKALEKTLQLKQAPVEARHAPVAPLV